MDILRAILVKLRIYDLEHAGPIDYGLLAWGSRIDYNKISSTIQRFDGIEWSDARIKHYQKGIMSRYGLLLFKVNTCMADIDIFQVYKLEPKYYKKYPSLAFYARIKKTLTRVDRKLPSKRLRLLTTFAILIFATSFISLMTILVFISYTDKWFDLKKMDCILGDTESIRSNLRRNDVGYLTRIHCYLYALVTPHPFAYNSSRFFFYAFAYYFMLGRKMNYFTNDWSPRADLAEIRFLFEPQLEMIRIDEAIGSLLIKLENSLKIYNSAILRQYHQRHLKRVHLAVGSARRKPFADALSCIDEIIIESNINFDNIPSELRADLSSGFISKPDYNKFTMTLNQKNHHQAATVEKEELNPFATPIRNCQEHESLAYNILRTMAQHNQGQLESFRGDCKILRPDTFTKGWFRLYTEYRNYLVLLFETGYHTISSFIVVSFVFMVSFLNCGEFWCDQKQDTEFQIIMCLIGVYVYFSLQTLSVYVTNGFMMISIYNVLIQGMELELFETLGELRALRKRQIALEKTHLMMDCDDYDLLDHDTDTIDEFNDLTFEANQILFKTYVKLSIELNELQRVSDAIGVFLEPAFSCFFLTIIQCIIGEASGLPDGRVMRLTLMACVWIGLNTIATIVARLATKLAQLEPICWSIITEYMTLMRLKHSHLIGQDFTSANLSRLVFSFNHARHLYIPHQFGQCLTYHKVLEQNFLISSMGSIFFTH